MLIRQGRATRILFVLQDSTGVLATGLVAADFSSSQVRVTQPDGTSSTLSLSGRLFEINDTAAPGLYHVEIPASYLAIPGELQVTGQPAAALFVEQTVSHQVYPALSRAIIDSVELLSQESVLVTFSVQLTNDSALQDPDNYTITPDGGVPVTVTDVITDQTEAAVSQVVLIFTRPDLGVTHTLEVANVIDTNAQTVTDLNKQFVDRLTKMDHVLKGLPQLYTREHRSVLRNVLQAFSRVDEGIGGNRSDSL